MNVVQIIRNALGLTRGRAREWAEWATENPAAAVTYCEVAGNFLDHRITVLEGRKRVWRRGKRLLRLRSAVAELRDLRDYFAELAQNDTTNPITIR